ncbi:MAG: NUDIX domain-containing protein [Bacteroidota bacterium]|nr:NUDIX domain-containing protein [Bacteroidota bacterium]
MTHISDTHPSHILNYCPRCGTKNFTFDEEKSFTCPNCTFMFYINAATAVAAILVAPDGRIVLTRRKFEPRAGTFDLPGGFVDPMESAEDAVKREVLEELGIEVNEFRFLASYPNEYVFRGISYFTCDLAFICPVADLSALKPADDVSEAILIEPNEIDLETISFPSIVFLLHKYIKTLKNS